MANGEHRAGLMLGFNGKNAVLEATWGQPGGDKVPWEALVATNINPNTGAPEPWSPMEGSDGGPAITPQAMDRSTDPFTPDELYDTKSFANGGPRHDQNLCCVTLICYGNFFMCPLHCLSTWGCTGIVDCLTSLPCKHIPCSPCDPNGKMPCWFCSEPVGWAASHGQLHTVMVLVKNGANPERVNASNNNAFTDATRERHQHVLDWLNIWKECPNK